MTLDDCKHDHVGEIRYLHVHSALRRAECRLLFVLHDVSPLRRLPITRLERDRLSAVDRFRKLC